jgi:hypothetical protein
MKKNSTVKFLFFLFLFISCLSRPGQVGLLGGITDVYADTHTAASCSRSDVQSAINAASDGDTVIVPTGNGTWSSDVTLSKGITLQGAGVGLTNITQGGSDILLSITGTEGKPFRVTGFTFNMSGGRASGTAFFATITVDGTCKNFRIDHCRLVNTGSVNLSGIEVRNYTYGLIDHCTFDGMQEVLINGEGDADWERPISLGSANATYIENCTFLNANKYGSGDDAVDSAHGARYVFRYNTVNDASITNHSGCPSGRRGAFSCEIYNNTQVTARTDVYRVMHFRSGTGVVFNNTVTGTWHGPNIHIDDERTCSSYCQSPWDRCDGDSIYDGNTPGMTGYPCRDQIGRATDSGITSPQASEPMYVWNNTINGATLTVRINPGVCAETANHIQKNRDYYEDIPKPGYAPYTYPHPLQGGTTPDTTPPIDITTVNDGIVPGPDGDTDSTSLTTELSANWTPSADGESGISKYWYAIGTSPGSTDVVGWTSTSNGSVTSVTRSNLSLTIGVIYYFMVKAENWVSLQSNPVGSDGQVVLSELEDKIDAKAYPNPYTFSESNPMTFSVGDTTGGEVKIYTISGKLVKKLLIGEGESKVNWNVLNKEGNRIANGLYIYAIKDGDKNKKTGKIKITK